MFVVLLLTIGIGITAGAYLYYHAPHLHTQPQYAMRESQSAPLPPRVVVCLDPGHPSEVNAGRTEQHGVTEVAINWQVSQRLAHRLRAKGITVICTKQTEDEYVTNRQRAEIANEHHAALFLRLHCDTGQGTGITFYYPNRQGTDHGHTGPSRHVRMESQAAATQIHQGTMALLSTALHDNGVKGESGTARGRIQGALTGSIFSQVPVVTVEMVYLSNARDAQFIRSVSGQQQIADALATGVECFLQESCE